MSVRITDHAHHRGRERLGWSHDALDRMAPRALAEGLSRSDTSGELARYLNGLVCRHGKGSNLRVYGRHVYIFQGVVLITVLNLPHRFAAAATKAAEKKGRTS